MRFARATITAALLFGCDHDARQEPISRPAVQASFADAGSPLRPISDALLSEAVRRTLDHPALAGASIAASVSDGVVTLRGSVPHLLAKQRHVRLVGNLRGVRSIVDLTRVDSDPVADRELSRNLRASLETNAATQASDISVYVDAGQVVLTGNVESWAERELAADVARATRGVREVDNRIEVSWPEQRADDEIAADVRARMRMDARLDGELVELRVNDGVVALSGSVGSYVEKTIAWRNAWVAGVERVDDSELAVHFSERERMRRRVWPSDREIERALGQALRLDPRVGRQAPRVEVRGGVAILTGSVESALAEAAAIEDAEHTTGVSRVQSHLSVRPELELSDTALKRRVLGAFERDPYAFDRQLAVEVSGGLVRIAGVVESSFQRNHAERVAARIAGVRGVENALVVVGGRRAPGSDEALRAAVSQQLYFNPRVDLPGTGIVVEDRVVTLSGRVDDALAVREAVDAAYRAGARDVRNALVVSRRAD